MKAEQIEHGSHWLLRQEQLYQCEQGKNLACYLGFMYQYRGTGSTAYR